MGDLRSNHPELFEKQYEDYLDKPKEKEFKMPEERKCPDCGSTSYKMEKCINGSTTCTDCGRHKKHAEFYIIEEIKEEKTEKPYGDKYFYQDEFDKNKYIQAVGQFIEAKGGDGTLLKAIHKFRHLGKAFFGIGAGTLNFLMNDNDKISPEAKYKKFRLIKVAVTFTVENDMDNGNKVQITEEFQAFNEVMMGGDMNTWAEFNVHDKDAIIGKFKGGGICISTAQGSTGFNMGNGGSILPLSSDQWFVTSAFSKRDIRVPIEPKRTTICAESRTPITVWIDGQNQVIQNVQKIEVSQGDSVIVIFNDYEAFKRKRRV